MIPVARQDQRVPGSCKNIGHSNRRKKVTLEGSRTPLDPTDAPVVAQWKCSDENSTSGKDLKKIQKESYMSRSVFLSHCVCEVNAEIIRYFFLN